MIDQANELRQLVEQQARTPTQAACTGPSMIAVTGGKGGVGTTTVAIHLAIALARGSDRVLLVDADPDRCDVAALCGLPVDCGRADLAVARQAPGELIVPGPEGIFVVAGARRTAASEPSADRFHARWLKAASEAEEPFDYVVVDTGNGSSRWVRRLWEAAELVLLVTTAELPSILDAYASIKTLADRANPPSIHTLVNRVNDPAMAYDVHGRLARAAWRFLGFRLDSAGHVAACQRRGAGEKIGQPAIPTNGELPLAREFGELARNVRTALYESGGKKTRIGQRTIQPGRPVVR